MKGGDGCLKVIALKVSQLIMELYKAKDTIQGETNEGIHGTKKIY